MSDKPTYRCMVCNEVLKKPGNYCDWCNSVVQAQRNFEHDHTGAYRSGQRSIVRCENCGNTLSWKRVTLHKSICRKCEEMIADMPNPFSAEDRIEHEVDARIACELAETFEEECEE